MIGTPLTGLALLQLPGPESQHPNPAFLYAAGAGPLFDLGPYYLTALVQVFGPSFLGGCSWLQGAGTAGDRLRAEGR